MATIEIDSPMTPEQIVKAIRKDAPHLVKETSAAPEETPPAAETGSLLTPSEVATMFRVDPKTVTRWAKAGKLTSFRTLGGHRRYRETEVRELLKGITESGGTS